MKDPRMKFVNEPYRGEDQTIKLIRERVKQIHDVKRYTNYKDEWEAACQELADEMEAEGLVTTATKIRTYSKTAKRFK